MKISRKIPLLVVLLVCIALTSCSDDKEVVEEAIIAMDDDTIDEANEDDGADDTNDGDSSDDDMTDDTMDDDTTDDETNDDDATDDTTSTLPERFEFNGNLVIENSWNTGGCDSPPCDTNDESLDNFFDAGEPNDPYFSLTDNESELLLECQFEKGRRIEFKQRSEGPLTSLSTMEFEAVYYDIPADGMTMAQVHNRGGSGNKPFFRLEIKQDGLETVIRKDPEVSSSDTTFEKEDYPFVNGEDYDSSPLKVVLEKSDGMVHITVTQNETVILDESYAPDSSTRWVTNSGINNGFYLKAGIYNAAQTHTKNLVLGYTTFKFNTNDPD